MKTIIAFCSLSLFLFLLVFSSHSIAGSSEIEAVSYNVTLDNYVVTGSGFGEKEENPLLLWDNFESGTLGNSLYSDGIWEKWNTLSPPVYASTKPYDGNSSAFFQLGEVVNDDFHGVGKTFSKSYKSMYATFYFWLSDNTDASSNPAGLIKFPRFSSGTFYNGLPYYYFTYFPSITNNVDGPQAVGGDIGDGKVSLGGYVSSSDRFDMEPNKWHRVEMFWKSGANGDGSFYYYVDFDDTDTLASNVSNVTTVSNSSYGVDKFLLQISADGNPTGGGTLQTSPAHTWIDNVYVSSGQARIELCDTNVWSARSHCEPQIPVSWSDSKISFNFNKGSFLTTDSVYLFVVSDDGVASAASSPISLSSFYTVKASTTDLQYGSSDVLIGEAVQAPTLHQAITVK